MFYHIFYNYCLFFIKVVTILIILIILIYFFLNVKKFKSGITIKNINKQYLYMQKDFHAVICEKKINKTKIKNLFLLYKKNKLLQFNKIFVINFNADIYAKQIFIIKQIISTVILVSDRFDQVFLKLTSSGGFISNYGLAANEFERFRKFGIKLVVSVDLIAASGGFLIAVVGNEIIAAEFAIIGSIGVLGIVPNFNKCLEKYNVDIEYHTSGVYKSTLSLFGKNTTSGRNKFIESLNVTHIIFKRFIEKYRCDINIDKIATGEYWYACDAIELNLIDKIQTSEEFILEHIKKYNMYEIVYDITTLKDRVASVIKFFR